MLHVPSLTQQIVGHLAHPYFANDVGLVVSLLHVSPQAIAPDVTSCLHCAAAVKSDETSKLQIGSAAQSTVVQPVVLNLANTFNPAPIVEVGPAPLFPA